MGDSTVSIQPEQKLKDVASTDGEHELVFTIKGADNLLCHSSKQQTGAAPSEKVNADERTYLLNDKVPAQEAIQRLVLLETGTKDAYPGWQLLGMTILETPQDIIWGGFTKCMSS